jgi:LmbE family N-acetylglucosaminyl deacetylase
MCRRVTVMLSVSLGARRRPLSRILCLGAHSDDIEIGCGGTILALLAQNPGLDIQWVVFSSGPQREQEAYRSATGFLRRARNKKIIVRDFRNAFFPFVGVEIKEFFEELKTGFTPDLVFTHYRHDRHQDHRVLSDLAWNTFRNHFILEYEIPKYDGDLGAPNFFVPIATAICQRKIKYLFDAFATQRDKQWFTRDTFLGLMRLRGIESNAPSGYAEAFYSRKAVLSDGK